MGVNTVSNTQTSADYTSYSATANAAAQAEAGKDSSKETAASGAVYEKSSQTSGTKATYSINKMSASDRAAIVKQMQDDQAARKQSLVNLVQDMLGKQAKNYGIAKDDDSIWKFLASGNFTVDAATKAQAQADIADDGYWGASQTSQRLFDFASALAGDDVDKMKEMQEAMQKGFKMATKTWGGSLPDISHRTMDAANKLFDDYFAAKGEAEA